ncbi:hypothetical protein A2291_06245 [candidate division WOR-1 bacterium RIFOXYB2_FULL_42_35]|uniref:GH26 domain-containing protein n=1 Tax=candidate division WOR-1 bacterium RIFOXYC2_FULL_41_25 TaxID=1802586 RepID=A0A1F4TIS3_UNCSA|nr:MAG: hypothetical protein A2247_07825 [candidate division WOR-1 bacterium RIFOXYA2_FULL_41_14]OGC21622.1 MAG: hypothetical protein A2291_06245 [candidate division WOR-1 bacterium RIFOXYB2_FULL_42_35]OGC32625.1 MAG: hypothetical protein A2462_02005 [candidate division WOR-1 bacterium RIFOXYC2_FULL_41_25]OGC41498.1 MAG: hypothetical protein A2548_04280 [candidate division WOR-1 bacterium RIFOXYD2_FULL_41_8]
MRQTFFIWFVILFFSFFVHGCGQQSPGTTTTTTVINSSFTGCAIGAYVNGTSNIAPFQTIIGKNLAVVLWYVNMLSPFPTAEADIVNNNGSIPHITWEPWLPDSSTLESIALGTYDPYIRNFFTAAKAWNKPLFLRFAQEMNGNWYPWDGFHNGQTAGPERYKQAWIHIYNLREEIGASKVVLVWSPNADSVPSDSWNSISAYYPGDQYVDWIGVDGYNWGYYAWCSFDTVFSTVYNTLTSLTQKPLMIGEFSSSEQGGSKAAWITDTFTKIESTYPRVKIFNWFNENKERDWRVNSSSTAETAFNTSLQDSYYLPQIP